jgi:hypothetical protein
MEKRILFVQHDENTQNAKKVRIHLEADRSAALQLLTLGTRCLMETLNISLYEYLEALMEAIAILKIPCKVRGAETPRTSLQPLKIRQDSLRTAPRSGRFCIPSFLQVILHLAIR